MNKRVNKIIEVLRTSTGDEILKALTYAPTENLLYLAEIFTMIASVRDRVSNKNS